MENIFTKLKNTQGIFDSLMSSKYYNYNDLAYRSIREDKINMQNDMRNLFTDIRKATDEAKIKLNYYE